MPKTMNLDIYNLRSSVVFISHLIPSTLFTLMLTTVVVLKNIDLFTEPLSTLIMWRIKILQSYYFLPQPLCIFYWENYVIL